MMCCVYLDTLKWIGYISEEDWDAVSDRFDNCIEIDVPEEIVKAYYEERLRDKYDMDFYDWFYNESICGDFDDLFGFHDWYPFLADVDGWSEMLREAKRDR